MKISDFDRDLLSAIQRDEGPLEKLVWSAEAIISRTEAVDHKELLEMLPVRVVSRIFNQYTKPSRQAVVRLEKYRRTYDVMTQ